MAWVQVESLVRASQDSAKLAVWSGDSKGHKDGKTMGTSSNEIQTSDLRIALYFLFFVQVGFFGPGKYVRLPIGSIIFAEYMGYKVLHR